MYQDPQRSTQQVRVPARSSGQTPTANQNTTQAPAITLPTGGGAIRGIDEKFQVNPATGSGAMTIPIATSPARQGFGPQLSLSYDSGSGSGPFGLGWSLSFPRVTRKTDKGLPTYRDGGESDVFILSGAEDLVPVLVENGGQLTRHSQTRLLHGTQYRVRRYRPRIEGLFARIERWTNLRTGAIHWRSITRDNVTTLYGRTDESRIADPEDPLRIFSWLICESFDDKGNAILYRYKAEDSSNVDLAEAHERNRTAASRSANRYLKRIHYGNRTPRQPAENLSERTDWMFEVVFDYGEGHLAQLEPDVEGRQFVESAIEGNRLWPVRQDPISSYRASFEVRTYRLCRRVLMFHHFPDELGTADYLVRATHFGYGESPINTVMTSMVQSGYLRQDDGRYQERSLPAVEFDYSQAVIRDDIREIDSDSLGNLPVGLAGSLYQWVDLDGEGISGILTEQGSGWFYKANLGNARFGPLETVAAKPSLAALNSSQQLMDLAGDGQLDLVTLGGSAPGFYERTHDRSWADHRPFDSVPSVTWNDPNLRFVDLTGDGHADLMVTEDQIITWYPSLAEGGYAASRRTPQSDDDETGPRLVFAEASQSIYLADMSGDGLTDLVRIRNGEVCYWPNLGYGNFGSKVTMDNAPWFDAPDLFDQKRIRLGDIDGSGITDIIYQGPDQVAVYVNQAGNGWAAARLIHHVPRVDNLSDVTVTDLFGNGTACLVWSSPLPGDMNRQMRYIDLMGGQKPHLMIGSRNNLGAETRVQYAASTRFYLEDKAAGRPWITRLPFPVHVVERIETYDHISRNRFVTRYAYHHGYFDGVEREFHGFGMIEQFDTEEFAALGASDELPIGENIEQSSHVPPVHTKTWFHTGVYLGRQQVSNFFAGLLDEEDSQEYYREPGLSDEQATPFLLPDSVLPEGLTVEEEREACRALKGSMLRQEVYADDAAAGAKPQQIESARTPYTVTEQNFTIRVVQRRGENRHAVFLTHARETINYHYERNPSDPRTSHGLTLVVDDYGNVVESAAIGYGRRQPDPALQPGDQAKQAQLLMTCVENSYTNAIEDEDQYRAPLPSDTLTFELAGLTLDPDQVRFSFAETGEAVQAATRIDYHQTPAGDLQKRVLEHTRTLYRPDDLGAAENDPVALLPLGVTGPMALPGESYQLVFTPEHLDLVFGARLTESMLSDEGRYVHFDGDNNWWIPSGRVFLSSNEADSAAQELAFAQQHFFMPRRFRDPFGQATTVEYDAHSFLPLETRDPLGNRVSAGQRDVDGGVTPRISYRVLQPEIVTDPNGNRSAVAFDVLGVVTGTAALGKISETIGDSLDGFQAQLTQAQIDSFFTDPSGLLAIELLGNASSRLLYDETRFLRLEKPAVKAVVSRETHVNDLGADEETEVQISLVYSDGFGRQIQTKAQAEPAPIAEGSEILRPRWIASGWTIFNNKGDPVKVFEPFFTANHGFEFGVTVGVGPTFLYDPLGRGVATLKPNHTWEKVLFDPWRRETWDVNDTASGNDPADDLDVGGHFRRRNESDYLPTWLQARIAGQLGDQEQDAATKVAAHADTPAIIHFDSLGRSFLSIADSGAHRQETRTEHDIEGTLLRVIDDRGNVVMAYEVETDAFPVPGYDMAGRGFYENSMDGGERRVLFDVGGKPIRAWDSRRHIQRFTYDELQRKTQLFVRREEERELLAEIALYGERHPETEERNLRGQVYQIYDGSGVATNQRFDFKNNLLELSRQFAREYRVTVDWSALADRTHLDEIESAAAPLLESELFTIRTEYDALNRPTAITAPDGSTTQPIFNEAGLLERMQVQLPEADGPTVFASNIDYNARRQRDQIVYAATDGTDVTTTYTYDPETFRLVRLRTVRHRDSAELQDLSYAYDPVGNITSIRDNAQQTVFFNNAEIEPHSDYTYDALYRLIRAEGREHAVQNNLQRDAGDFDPIIDIPFANSPEALQRYVEEYAYDDVGNIESVRHIGGAVQRWTRRYQYAVDSNRLLATSIPGDGSDEFSASYSHDAHGNISAMPHVPLMRWDFRDQLQATSRQVVNNGGTPETTFYLYSSSGERVRKVTERQAGPGQIPTRRAERFYLGDFAVYREYNGDGVATTLERQTLQVTDGQQRIARVDTRTHGNEEAPAQSRRFQLSNHLGSAVLEIDNQANLTSYEEFHPFGTSAYRAGRSTAEVSLKPYRYIGKERDEETGLYYHGARYYACWLGRWTAPDPAKLADGANRFRYARNNPVLFIDEDGMGPKKGGDRPSLPGSRYPRTVEESVEIGEKVLVDEQGNTSKSDPNQEGNPHKEAEKTGRRQGAEEPRASQSESGGTPSKSRAKPAPTFDPPEATVADPHTVPESTSPHGTGKTARGGKLPYPPETADQRAKPKTNAPVEPRIGRNRGLGRSRIGGGKGGVVERFIIPIVVFTEVYSETDDAEAAVKEAARSAIEAASPLPTPDRTRMELDTRDMQWVRFGSQPATETLEPQPMFSEEELQQPGLIKKQEHKLSEGKYKLDQKLIRRIVESHRQKQPIHRIKDHPNTPATRRFGGGRGEIPP